MRGWFKERWETIGEAAGVRKYVLGAIIATVFGALDWIERWAQELLARWFVLETRPEDVGMVFGFPSWIIGVTVAFALLWWWTLEYAVRLRRRLNPSIVVTFTEAAPWVRPSPANTHSRDDPQRIVSTDSIFVRFKVENTTPGTVVRGCEAFLMGVFRENSSGNFVEVSSGDSLRLPWASRPKDKIHGEISIPYGLNVFCDLLSVDAEHNSVFVKWDVHLNVNLNICSMLGVYRFDVLVISANGGPVTKQIFLNWQGQWNTIKTWAE